MLNGMELIGFHISEDENPADRWHLYKVKISKDEIQKLSKYIRAGKWYMHFWKERDLIAVFKDKIFEFNYDNKASWASAIEYGLSLGIPEEQLDFVIE